ncbi:MAG: hypothetical protein IKT33_02410 [Clostridia bacterium]|nr:hypothetical protein [Clostridia bacterium]
MPINSNLGSCDNQTKYDFVPLNTFLGKKNTAVSKMDLIIEKITNNLKVREGIKSILDGEILFRSFNRAITILLTAKNKAQLERADRSLQIAANEIKNYEKIGGSSIPHYQIALYLYTIQELMINLDKWKLPGNQETNYVPSIIEKLRNVKFKCACLGLNEDVIREECFSNDYQIPYDDVLRNFVYLDEEEVDAFLKRLSRYEVTQYYGDLYKKTLQSTWKVASEEYDIGIILCHIKINLGINRLTLKSYEENHWEIRKIINQYIGTDDIYPRTVLANALKDYLLKEEQYNKTLHRYDNGRVSE